jgi:hypothetical protein
MQEVLTELQRIYSQGFHTMDRFEGKKCHLSCPTLHWFEEGTWFWYHYFD